LKPDERFPLFRHVEGSSQLSSASTFTGAVDRHSSEANVDNQISTEASQVSAENGSASSEDGRCSWEDNSDSPEAEKDLADDEKDSPRGSKDVTTGGQDSTEEETLSEEMEVTGYSGGTSAASLEPRHSACSSSPGLVSPSIEVISPR
jgi:hypothetical protein